MLILVTWLNCFSSNTWSSVTSVPIVFAANESLVDGDRGWKLILDLLQAFFLYVIIAKN